MRQAHQAGGGGRKLAVVFSASEDDAQDHVYPEFEEDARTWGLQTSAGMSCCSALRAMLGMPLTRRPLR